MANLNFIGWGSNLGDKPADRSPLAHRQEWNEPADMHEQTTGDAVVGEKWNGNSSGEPSPLQVPADKWKDSDQAADGPADDAAWKNSVGGGAGGRTEAPATARPRAWWMVVAAWIMWLLSSVWGAWKGWTARMTRSVWGGWMSSAWMAWIRWMSSWMHWTPARAAAVVLLLTAGCGAWAWLSLWAQPLSNTH